MSEYYQFSPVEDCEFLCSPNPDGIRQCKDIPPLRQNGQTCMLVPPSANWSSALLANSSALSNSTACNCVFIGIFSVELVANVLLYGNDYFTDWENIVGLAIIIIG